MILPIKSIRPEDSQIVGKQLVNLAKLAQGGLPVPEGVVVSVPDFGINSILKYCSFNNLDSHRTQELFEQNLTLIKSEFLKIPISEELENELKLRKVETQKIWQELLESWFEQTRSLIFREGLTRVLTQKLEAKPLFFTKQIKFSGSAHLDPLEGLVVVESKDGLTPEQIDEIDSLVRRADTKLYFPHIYSWIFDGNFKIVKINEFTQPIGRISEKQMTSSHTIATDPQSKGLSSVQIYLDSSEVLTVPANINGTFFRSESISDFDSKVWKLVEEAVQNPQLTVIFRLADIRDKEKVRGTLRLIHEREILKKEVEAFLFARHKKQLLNTQIAVPLTRSVDEFLQVKRDLASLGISRKGSLKLWLEIGVPENIVQLEEYIVAGLDGVIINLDELAAGLKGLSEEEGQEVVYYKTQVQGLMKFLEDGLKLLRKTHLPFLMMGELAIHHEMLEFVIKKGAQGLIVSPNMIHSINEQINLVEKRIIRSRLN